MNGSDQTCNSQKEFRVLPTGVMGFLYMYGTEDYRRLPTTMLQDLQNI